MAFLFDEAVALPPRLFGDLRMGDIFKLDSTIYMKTANSPMAKTNIVGAVNLQSGLFVEIHEDLSVEQMRATKPIQLKPV